MFQQLDRKLDRIEKEMKLNTASRTALVAAILAVGTAVADVGKAIAAHPAAQADDSGEIVAAAEKLQGFAGQLEDLAGAVNADTATGDTANAPGAAAPAPAEPAVDAAPAGEAGTIDGHAAEPTPEVVAEDPAQTVAS